jgi:DNA gyrase inhibitor GyrI
MNFKTIVSTALLAPGLLFAIEKPGYETIEKDGKFEVRKYEAIPVVSAPMDNMGQRDQSFRKLFQYISGANEKKQKIAMTSPVFMEGKADDKGENPNGRMSFVVPAAIAKTGTPQPDGEGLKTSEIKGGKVAVLRFSGWDNEANRKKAITDLSTFTTTKKLLLRDEVLRSLSDEDLRRIRIKFVYCRIYRNTNCRSGEHAAESIALSLYKEQINCSEFGGRKIDVILYSCFDANRWITQRGYFFDNSERHTWVGPCLAGQNTEALINLFNYPLVRSERGEDTFIRLIEIELFRRISGDGHVIVSRAGVSLSIDSPIFEIFTYAPKQVGRYSLQEAPEFREAIIRDRMRYSLKMKHARSMNPHVGHFIDDFMNNQQL